MGAMAGRKRTEWTPVQKQRIAWLTAKAPSYSAAWKVWNHYELYRPMTALAFRSTIWAIVRKWENDAASLSKAKAQAQSEPQPAERYAQPSQDDTRLGCNSAAGSV